MKNIRHKLEGKDIMRYKPDFKKQNCPYCGKQCISFLLRIKAGPNKYYRFPKCPECGASIRFTENQTLIKFLINALLVVLYVIAALHSDVSMLIIWSVFFVAATLICELAFAAFGKIDYEGTWKYPKPPEHECNAAGEDTERQDGENDD